MRIILFFLLLNLANCQIFQQQASIIARPNQPCNPERDVLLMDNSAASPSAYLRCSPIGISGMGYWSQGYCPSGMNFDFLTQACKFGQTNVMRKDDLLNIGIG
jgi:hypothetical protein